MTNNNKIIISGILFCVFSFVNIAKAELIGYWKLNEGTGTVANDSSGKNHPGSITGAAWYNDSAMGNVLDFEGMDYVTIPASAFSTVNSKITIALWQNGDTAIQPQDDSIFYGADAAGNRVLNCHLPWHTSNVFWDAGYVGTIWDRISKTATANEFEGRWNHWAFTKDTTSGQMKVYLNGLLWTSGMGLTKPMSGITTFKIGSQAKNDFNYDGMICEFRVYNEVLSLTQIGELAGQAISTEPVPANKAIDIEPYPILSWTPGRLAQSHDIYIGTNKDLVANRNPSVYAGRVTTNSFAPSMLRLATIYYWAVDDRNDSVPGSPWLGEVWKLTVRNSTEGYYKDIFFDGGVYTDGYKASDIPACGMLGYSNEHIDTESMSLNQNIMGVTAIGAWKDGNGVLLYPDREPRFRMMFVNGGDSTIHFDRIGTAAQNNVHDFYFNGGSYTGSCAGAWMTGAKRFNIMPIFLGSAHLGKTYVRGTLPDGQTSYQRYINGNWVWKPALPRSPFIDYYPEVFDDFKLSGIRENGGCCVNPLVGEFDENAEALMLYDYSWSLRYAEPNNPEKDLTQVGTSEQKGVHNQCMVWSYKHASGTTGKQVPCGAHPEHDERFGEEKFLQAAIFRHAFSGFGRATSKGALIDGVTRLMNDNTRAAYAKIGDLQYHHFTFDVQPGTIRLQINLDGNLYDMNLYAKWGDFAFDGERDVLLAANGKGSDEILVIDNPKPGTWYIGVKCNDKVVATYGSANYNYSDNLDLLNGIPYSISAATKKIVEGDIDYDGKVDGLDLKLLANNWLIDNSHTRQVGELAGKWDFACEDANERFAKDSGGYGNTVTFYGDANWAQEGIVFDGTGDYLQTEVTNDLQLTNAYTIAFRVNADSAQAEGAGIISKRNADTINNQWTVCFGGASLAGKMLMMNGTAIWQTGIELSKVSGGWHNVAIVCGAGFMSSYLDGQQVKWEPFATLPSGGQGILKIGCDRLQSRYYKGLVDDISIFNYELSPQEIDGLFESSSMGKAAGKWMFSDGTAMDSSGNDNHGTLMADAAIVADEQRGNVLNLEGTAYVTLPADAFADVNDQVTVSLWQYGSDNQPGAGYIFYAENEYGKVLSANLPWSDGVVNWDAGNITTDQYDRIAKTASTDEYKGGWNHWVFTKNASEETMAIYLNGQLWNSGTGKMKLMSGITSFTISDSISSYEGKIDDFSVYNYSMTDSEIENIYQSGLIERKVCPKNPACDLNGDCIVNYQDYAKVARNWLK